jgi:uncharacterized protein (TIGR02996 family)
MTEREALLRAVCEFPDDDTPRLVFADWLQEHGEEERAEFIRVQCRLARKDDERLRQRARELLAAHRESWSQPFQQFEVAGSFRRLMFGVQFRRGFVFALSVNDEESRFVENAAALFRLAPVQRLNPFHKHQHEDLTRCPELLRVTELMIDRQGFETVAIAQLLRSKYLTNITRLDLIADDDNGHLETEGLALFARAKSLPALRHLDLSYNYCGWMFSDERENWLARLLNGPLIGQLETLRLRSTDVTDGCALALARCKRTGALRHLDVSGNSLSERSLRALANSPHLSGLTTLDLRENDYDYEGGSQLRECPPELRTLLQARFGTGLILEGKADPHPHDELFKEFA